MGKVERLIQHEAKPSAISAWELWDFKYESQSALFVNLFLTDMKFFMRGPQFWGKAVIYSKS